LYRILTYVLLLKLSVYFLLILLPSIILGIKGDGRPPNLMISTYPATLANSVSKAAAYSNYTRDRINKLPNIRTSALLT